VWSPKSDRLLYTSEDCALHMVDLGGSVVQIAKNEHRDITSYSWSPDGKWVAYDFSQKNRNRDIFIYDVAKRESRQINVRARRRLRADVYAGWQVSASRHRPQSAGRPFSRG